MNVADPGFVHRGTDPEGFKLRPDSPAVGKGTPIPGNGGVDYFGNALYNGVPDIGAAEYYSQATPPASDGTRERDGRPHQVRSSSGAGAPTLSGTASPAV